MQAIEVKYRQSLFDIAIQYTGDVGNAVKIADLNGVSVTDTIPAGTMINVEIDETNNIVRDFTEKGTYPGTLAEPDGGIGSMGIGMDFIIH